MKITASTLQDLKDVLFHKDCLHLLLLVSTYFLVSKYLHFQGNNNVFEFMSRHFGHLAAEAMIVYRSHANHDQNFLQMVIHVWNSYLDIKKSPGVDPEGADGMASNPCTHTHTDLIKLGILHDRTIHVMAMAYKYKFPAPAHMLFWTTASKLMTMRQKQNNVH